MARLGLVLGGGGSRGLAHIGVLQVLSREQTPIDLVVGTSMGAIIGVLFALGYTPQEMEAHVKRWQRHPLLSLKNLTVQSRQKQLAEFLEALIDGKTFADLSVPMVITATDMSCGVEVELAEGDLVTALLASSAMPGAFPPVMLNGHELGDGGVIDSLATGVAYQRGAQKVIAVDVFPPLSTEHPWPDPISDFFGIRLPVSRDAQPSLPLALWRSVRVVSWYVHQQRLAAHPPDILLRPNVDDRVSLDFRDVAEPIQAGFDEAERHLAAVKALIQP